MNINYIKKLSTLVVPTDSFFDVGIMFGIIDDLGNFRQCSSVRDSEVLHLQIHDTANSHTLVTMYPLEMDFEDIVQDYTKSLSLLRRR